MMRYYPYVDEAQLKGTTGRLNSFTVADVKRGFFRTDMYRRPLLRAGVNYRNYTRERSDD